MEAAAWTSDGTVRLHGDDVTAYTVAASGREVASLSIATLLARYANGRADFVKFDVEGAEVRLLAENTAWTNSVRCVSVEVHAPYSVARCTIDLQALGFAVTTKSAPRIPRVVGQHTEPAPE